jgi:hypothetical protein
LAKGGHSGGHSHHSSGSHHSASAHHGSGSHHAAAKPTHKSGSHAHAANHAKSNAAKTTTHSTTAHNHAAANKSTTTKSTHKSTKAASVNKHVARSVSTSRGGYSYGRRNYYRHLTHRRHNRRGYAYGRPSFMRGPDQVVAANSGPQVVNPWATRITPGLGQRTGGGLRFQVTRDSNPRLFRTPPTISPTGTLAFCPAARQTGAATITVVLRSGGHASTPQTFHITVRPA